ncbi:MAG: HD domain-containing protein [Planctomycetaceae bacterium]|jgi:tRNA nucleotidyltransferase (CCA-adding enzyme)|nr:HD domain-containing protein [Planctomycetaceae bacterium]
MKRDFSLTLNPKVKRVIQLLTDGGASDCLFVGGSVRDHFLGLETKEFDIEVYGLSYKKILKILRPHFHVGLVGQSFGTVKVDNEIDLSIPRTESKAAAGHKGFHIESVPHLPPEIAFARRDFTINAVGLRIDGTVIDPFNGRRDLEQKILRAPTEAFCEDPLRVLRGMQFAARFGFDIEPQTVELCRRVLPEFPTLSAERVWAEWEKWAVKGRFPGKGLQLLQETGWIACFPEIAALPGVPQHQIYHPEGDVFTHTKLTCDAAVKIADAARFSSMERGILLFAALCHDFGKPAATVLNDRGYWSAPNHPAVGVPLARSFLQRLGAPNRYLEHVPVLVGEHQTHMCVPDGERPGAAAVRRLAVRLEPSNIRMWSAVCQADAGGCGPGVRNYKAVMWEETAAGLNVRESKPKPVLQGRDLIALGIPPGREMGKILRRVYEAQLDGLVTNFEEAKKMVFS